jgi:3'-phosphoadenosine 5'-phosphosulfate sulfotransferase (PAPS reductase)/FAD synthetase
MTDEQSTKPVRHLLGLSGGKDSSALAIYLRDKVPEMEYFFADTGAELPETLEFVDLMEDYLGKNIIRLNAEGLAKRIKASGINCRNGKKKKSSLPTNDKIEATKIQLYQ